MLSVRDEYWMQQALKLADKAEAKGEVPVGALLVFADEVIGEGHNCPIETHDPTAHAEMVALRAGAKHLDNYRLCHTTLYVTLEPCLMCVGAMVHARIKRLVYGAKDPKTGAVESVIQALDLPFLNHKIKHDGGLLADASRERLSRFFQVQRQANKLRKL